MLVPFDLEQEDTPEVQLELPRTEDTDYLKWTMTVTEAARVYHKHPKTIKYHMAAGNIAYRWTGELYLVSVHSLNRLYGKVG